MLWILGSASCGGPGLVLGQKPKGDYALGEDGGGNDIVFIAAARLRVPGSEVAALCPHLATALTVARPVGLSASVPAIETKDSQAAEYLPRKVNQEIIFSHSVNIGRALKKDNGRSSEKWGL
jgi:hypothetical protein